MEATVPNEESIVDRGGKAANDGDYYVWDGTRLVLRKYHCGPRCVKRECDCGDAVLRGDRDSDRAAEVRGAIPDARGELP